MSCSPPRSLKCRENPSGSLWKLPKMGVISYSRAETGPEKMSFLLLPAAFCSLLADEQSGFTGASQANAMRSQSDVVAKAT